VSRRAAELRAVGTRKARDYELRRAGGMADVVVLDGAAAGRARRALTEDYLTVSISDMQLPRGTRSTAMLEARDGALFARPVVL
jgi:hypothetical protein